MRTGKIAYNNYSPEYLNKLAIKLVNHEITEEKVKEILGSNYVRWYNTYYLKVANMKTTTLMIGTAMAKADLNTAVNLSLSRLQQITDYLDKIFAEADTGITGTPNLNKLSRQFDTYVANREKNRHYSKYWNSYNSEELKFDLQMAAMIKYFPITDESMVAGNQLIIENTKRRIKMKIEEGTYGSWVMNCFNDLMSNKIL